MTEDKEDLFHQLKPWYELKIREFSELGYENIQVDDIHRYFQNFLWKNSVPPHYYQKVRDIMKFTVNQYFDFETLEAQIYRVSSLDEMDLNDFW